MVTAGYLFSYLFIWDGVLFCHPGWSPVAWSQPTATSTSQVQDSLASASQVAGITGTQHHAWLIFVFLVETGFHMLARLVFNSWPQVIHLPQPPKVLGEPPCLACIILFVFLTDFSVLGYSVHKGSLLLNPLVGVVFLILCLIQYFFLHSILHFKILILLSWFLFLKFWMWGLSLLPRLE